MDKVYTVQKRGEADSHFLSQYDCQYKLMYMKVRKHALMQKGNLG